MSVEISGDCKNSSDITYSSLEEYLKMTSNDINILFESELGIKLSPGCNYMLSEYDNDTNEREVFFDGAIPLHDILYCIVDFFDSYMLENNKNKTYILAIVKDTSPIIVSMITGGETESERYENIKPMAKEVINILERSIGFYMTDSLKKKTPYRTDTTFKLFESSVNYYIKNIKDKLQKYI
jgi:hypothetical protein